MQNMDDARKLAKSIIRISALNGVTTEAVVTSMDVPLGRAVGNAVEVIEAIETLKRRGPADTEQLSIELTARMVMLAGIETSLDAAVARVRAALNDGSGLERFRQIIAAQGGDAGVIDDYARLPAATHQATVTASSDGTLTAIDAGRTGHAAVVLGAGRDRADADVDPSAGIELLLVPGVDVRAGEAVAVVSGRDKARVDAASRAMAEALVIGERGSASPPLVRETLTGGDAA
jgi:thymidine phosphorylase